MTAPKNSLDVRDIIVRLSFNQIKCILYRFQNFQVSSEEGEISTILVEELKKNLEKKIKKGNLPIELNHENEEQ